MQLYRITATKSVPFFKGTKMQCFWKLLRHVVNLETVMVENVPATSWIQSFPKPSFTFKTSVTGYTISCPAYGKVNKINFLRALKRAEKKFATNF